MNRDLPLEGVNSCACYPKRRKKKKKEKKIEIWTNKLMRRYETKTQAPEMLFKLYLYVQGILKSVIRFEI